MSSFKSSHENEKTIRRANIDFVNNSSDLDEIINYIRQPASGTKFFNPTSDI